VLAAPLVFGLLAAIVVFTPLRGFISPPDRPAAGPPVAAPAGRVASVYTNAIEGRVIFQQPIDRLPEGALLMRLTELEMEPGSRIFEHRQLGPGAHIVHQGSISVTDTTTKQTETYQPLQTYYVGMDPLHEEKNNGTTPNRVLMAELVPQSRGFDGNQAFTDRGKHNDGEVRSGPYVQLPLANTPEGPLMLRVSEIKFGPKSKTVEHLRMGPTLFRVEQGGLTIRREALLHMFTYGTNGYCFDAGLDPLVLENKPASPMRVLMVEVLPTSLGDGPSTRITSN
jgi:hypothetical protein